MTSETPEGFLVCTKALLPLIDHERARARIQGQDVVVDWSAGACRFRGLAATGLKSGSVWMIGVVDDLGRPTAAMDVDVLG